MPKLSIVIPSRDDLYLTKTIEGIFENARSDVHVWAVIDGGSWPPGWADTVERYSPRLHTIRHGASKGMRAGINAGVNASNDSSNPSEYILKCDSHVKFSAGFDTILMQHCGDREIVIPRRYRLNCEAWEIITDDGKPPVDYEYLSFPELKGKVWNDRAKERAEITCDETPLFQGSCWLMKRSYFEFLDLMDEESFGTFWKEALELSLKAYLSGGRVLTVKHAHYAHPHVKRTYKLDSAEHVKAHEHSQKWLTDSSGWAKQTLPFSSFISRFAMPSWPPGWNATLVETNALLKVGAGSVECRAWAIAKGARG